MSQNCSNSNNSFYEEIDLGNQSKIVLFCNVDFWDSLLPTSFEESEYLDVMTYNFKFNDQRSKSMYGKLLSLSELGIRVRLFFSSKVSDDTFIDNIFSEEILTVKIPNNHCKIFLSAKKAFIGSANFSLGSNNNYECGFYTENHSIITKIRDEFLNNHIWKNCEMEIVNVPRIDDPLFQISEIINDINNSIRFMKSDSYTNEYVPFAYKDLIKLYSSLKDSLIPCDYEELLAFYEELYDYLSYVYTEQPQYTKDEAANLKHSLICLLSYLEELKKTIVLFYKKYGKHEIMNH